MCQEEKLVNSKAKKLLIIFLSWYLILLLAHSFILQSNPEQENSYKKSLSLKENIIPGFRGSIIDSNGKKIVWTKISYNLYLTPPKNIYIKKEIITSLKKIFPKLKQNYNHIKKTVLITAELTPQHVKKLLPIINNFSELFIKKIYKREYSSLKVKEAIGEVKLKNGELIGISGYEKKYDKLLRGKPGKYSVRTNSKKEWINNNIKFDILPQKGEDIILKISEEELIQQFNSGRSKQ